MKNRLSRARRFIDRQHVFTIKQTLFYLKWNCVKMAGPEMVENGLFSVISVGKKQLPPPGARQPRRQVGERAGWLVRLGWAWLGLAWLGLAKGKEFGFDHRDPQLRNRQNLVK